MNLTPQLTITVVPHFLEASASGGHLSSDLFSEAHQELVTVFGKTFHRKQNFLGLLTSLAF